MVRLAVRQAHGPEPSRRANPKHKCSNVQKIEDNLANKCLDNLDFENLNLFGNSCLGFRIFETFANSSVWQDIHQAGLILAVTLMG